MKTDINFKDEEMQMVVHRSMEIYETMKNCIIKIEDKKLDTEDKKYLALLLGITSTKNDVESIIKLLKWEYGINIFPVSKSYEECNEIFKNDFYEMFNQNNITEDKTSTHLMLVLLQKKVIQDLHHSLGLPIFCIKLILCNIIKQSDENSLQKNKTKTIDNKYN